MTPAWIIEKAREIAAAACEAQSVPAEKRPALIDHAAERAEQLGRIPDYLAEGWPLPGGRRRLADANHAYPEYQAALDEYDRSRGLPPSDLDRWA